MKISFPKNFFWGAATSSHQVEGGNTNNWSKWEKQNAERLAKKARVNWQKAQLDNFPEMLNPDNYISGRACDHYNLFDNDFNIAKSLNHNAHRFSIEWSRIEPEEGKYNEKEIEHYKHVIASLRKLKIEPFITLWHWTMPIWFSKKGGFEKKENFKYFERFAKIMAENFKDEIKFWITLNEPEIYSVNSYLTGIWPPQRKNPLSFLKTFTNLAKVHKTVYQIIKDVNPNALIGIAKNNVYYSTESGINKCVRFFADWFWNFYFLNKIKKCQDFIGLNYYFHHRINYGFSPKANPPTVDNNKKNSDLDWELYPEGIYHLLINLKKYNKPIYITENGLADAQDLNRKWFIKENLKYVHKAIQEGTDVRGYFYWSLLDNFEWDKGFWPRFGLIEIDYKTLERKIRPSAEIYAEICHNNGFNL